MMQKEHIYLMNVRPEHIDVYNHLNNAHYSLYYSEAEKNFWGEFEDLAREIMFTSSSSKYRFLRQLKEGEAIEIKTCLDQEGCLLKMKQTMSVDGKPASYLERIRTTIPMISDYADIHNLEVNLARGFEAGRIDAQNANGLFDENVLSKEVMLVVYSAKHEAKSCIMANSAFISGSISLESRFIDYRRGPKIILEQRLYSGEPILQNELATSISEHVFIDAATGKPLLHPEERFLLGGISKKKCLRYIEPNDSL